MVRPVTNDDIGLKVLREAPAGAAEILDIVAIHGIGDHPDDTWRMNVGTAESPQWVNWLDQEDMLPAVAPHARTMRYGYHSQWFGKEAMRQRASAVAQRLLIALRLKREMCTYRPLLFIAHCFGGLVVLKALLDARQDEKECPGVFKSTIGLVFFGTPFRGAEGMIQIEMLEAAQREYDKEEVQLEVLKILEPGNEFLQELVDQFGKTRREVNKIAVACFYELKSSNVGKIVGGQDRTRFVVSEWSGCLDLSDGVSKFPLSRTHFDMNKFGKPTEEDFEIVCDVIKRMIEAPRPSDGSKLYERSLSAKVPLERSTSPRLLAASSEGVQALWSDTGLRNHVPVLQTSSSKKKKATKSSTGKVSTERPDVRSNSTDQYTKNGPQFGCQTCDKKFQLKEAANQHMADTGHGNSNIPCKTCTKKFSTQSAAMEHMAATGHGNPSFPCKTCTTKFYAQSAANQHMTATGHGNPSFSCKKCTKKFYTRSAAIEHMEAVRH